VAELFVQGIVKTVSSLREPMRGMQMVDMWVGTTAYLLFLPKPRAQVDIVSSLRRFFKFGTSTVSPFQE